MMTDQKIAFYTSELRNGGLSSEQQIAMADEFVEFVIEHRRLRNALDQIANDSALDERERAEAHAIHSALPIAEVLLFPTLLRRPMLSVPPIQAIEGETWR